MRLQVSFEVNIPDGIDDDDIEEWLRFELNESGSLRGDNPLVDTELEAVWGSIDF